MQEKRGIAKTYTFKPTENTHIILYLQFLLTQLELACDTIGALIQAAQQNLFPNVLADGPKFQELLKTIVTDQEASIKGEAVLELMLGRSIFFPIYGPCKSEKCVLQFLLFVPITSNHELYTLIEIENLPFTKKGIITNDWKRVTLPFKHVVSGDHKTYDYESFDCFHDLWRNSRPCELCKFTDKSSHDECVETIIEKKILGSKCEYENAEPDDIAIQVDNDDFLYADRTPGVLKETCDTEERSINLPQTGRIRFDPSCTYTFNENVLSDMDLESSAMSMSRPGSESDLNDHDQTHVSIIEEHFHEHSFAYILSMVLLFVTATLSSGAYAFMQRRRHRVITIRNQRSESPDVGQALVRFINRDRGV
jgi:hypothetical protein